MNVLHVVAAYFPLSAGYTVRTRELCLAQQKAGIRPRVLVGPYFPMTAKDPDGKVCVSQFSYKPIIPQWVFSAQPRAMSAFSREIAKVAKSENTDILHSHTPPLIGFAAALAKKRPELSKIPWVHEVRGFPEETWRASHIIPPLFPRYFEDKIMRRYALKHADAVIAISHALAEELKKIVPGKHVHVIPNGVDTEKFSPSIAKEKSKKIKAFREKLRLKGPVILYAGDVRPIEGLDVAVKAMKSVRQEFPEAKLLIVQGIKENRPERQSLEALIKALGISDAVVFSDRIDRGRMPEVIAACDVYVLPRLRSMVSELVTPLKPYEPMAEGKVVIASDLPAMREIISDGETGLLSVPGGDKSLAESIKLALSDRNLAAEIGRNARKWVERERDWKEIGKLTRHVYESVRCL